MAPTCIMDCKKFKHLFEFPSDDDDMQNWCIILGLDSDEIFSSDKLCERHFDPKFVCGNKLKMGAYPETLSTSVEKNITTEYETIHITRDGTPKRSYQKKKYKKKSSSEERIKIETIDDAGFEPVQISFETPPKRTYAQGSSGKVPQLDITTTCYCRCHKGEEDEHRQLLISVQAMKKKIEEQSQEIQMLTSQNNISEHLLKTKMRRIGDLVSLEQSLKKEIETLNKDITKMSTRQIKAADDASENSITLARMVCDKRRMYTKDEILIAQKMYSVSSRCYNFMRRILKLNLPHSATLMRQRQLNANSYMAQAHDVGEPELEIEPESVG